MAWCMFAILQASTPLLALVDVDMLLSSQVYEGLKRPSVAQALVQVSSCLVGHAKTSVDPGLQHHFATQ